MTSEQREKEVTELRPEMARHRRASFYYQTLAMVAMGVQIYVIIAGKPVIIAFLCIPYCFAMIFASGYHGNKAAEMRHRIRALKEVE
jgi:hypothetical protein